MKISKAIYFFIFLCILLLTQSNLWINYDSSPALFGLPAWLCYFIIFHILFVIALFFFVKRSSE
jgi:hypothetical protein